MRKPERESARKKKWSGKRDSNPRHLPWQGRALPTELFPPQMHGLSRLGEYRNWLEILTSP